MNIDTPDDTTDTEWNEYVAEHGDPADCREISQIGTFDGNQGETNNSIIAAEETGQVGQGDLANLNAEQRFYDAVNDFTSILRTSVGAAWHIGNELNTLASEVQTNQLGNIIDRSGLSRRSARRFQRLAKNYTEAEITVHLTIQAAYNAIEPARTSSTGQIPMSDDTPADKAVEPPPFTQQEIDAESREIDLLTDEAQEAESLAAEPDLQDWYDLIDRSTRRDIAMQLRDLSKVQAQLSQSERIITNIGAELRDIAVSRQTLLDRYYSD